MTVGELVRAERTTQRLTQRELARKAGVSRTTLGSIERDQTLASLAVMGRIAEALGKQFVIELLAPAATTAAEMALELQRLRQVVDTLRDLAQTFANYADTLSGRPWATYWNRIHDDTGQFPNVRLKVVVTINGVLDDSLLGTIRKAAEVAEATAPSRRTHDRSEEEAGE